MIKNSIIYGAIIVLIPILGALALVVFPRPIFSYSYKTDRIAFYSDRSINDTQAKIIAHDTLSRLSDSPLGLEKDKNYEIYIANDKWRRNLLWNLIASSNAFGYAVYPLSRNHAFLSGANFKTNQLVAPSGRLIGPPRTLAYYAAHELTHVRTGQVVGTIHHLTMPDWIMEGVADYVAFRPGIPFTELYKEIAPLPNGPKLWSSHGYYAHFRLLVQFFLEIETWSVHDLLVSKLTYEEAKSHMLEKVKIP